MLIFLLSCTVPAIVVMVVVSPTPQAECSVIECVMIHTSIVTVSKMDTIVSTTIGVIVHRHTKVEIVAVSITRIDAHTPTSLYHIDRTVEIVTIDKSAVLTVTEHIHKVLIAHIEQIVIIVNGVVIAIHHIVNHLVHLIEEIEIDFIYIIVLAVTKSKFMSHTVGKEACLTTDFRQAHRRITLHTYSCQGYKHNG